MLILVLLAPPLGLLAAVTAPELRLWRKLLGAVGLVLLGGVLAAMEEEGAYFSRFWLDLTATVNFEKALTRYARQPAQRTATFERAFALEPPPGQANVLGERPGVGDSAYRLGRVYERDGDLHRARLWLSAASVPKGTRVYGDAQLALAEVELRMGLVERAAARLDNALNEHAVKTDTPEFMLLRGRLLSHTSSVDARATLMSIVWRRAVPYLQETHSELAALDLAEHRPDDALRHLFHSMRVDPGNKDALEDALKAASQAKVAAVSVRAFQRACLLQSTFRAGDIAETLYRKLVAKYPKFPGADLCYLHIAAHHETDEKDPHEAMRWYRRAADAAVDRYVRVEALAKLGRVYVTAGLPKGAERCFRQVLDDAEPESYYRRVARFGLERLSRSSEVRERLERIDSIVERFAAPDDDED
ncbi:MAG: tetratricopeptide repeat protein [Candidatus Wallbacteria bacterium]|nr:tetratricopeptide repeat protein [Candidatus Wallbacteria bacterium]